MVPRNYQPAVIPTAAVPVGAQIDIPQISDGVDGFLHARPVSLVHALAYLALKDFALFARVLNGDRAQRSALDSSVRASEGNYQRGTTPAYAAREFGFSLHLRAFRD